MSDFINKKTFEIRKSVHDPNYENLDDWFICNDMVIPDCGWKYKKWNDAENKIEEMSQAEKDVVDETYANVQTQAEENAKDIDKMEKRTKALALVILDEINALRGNVGVPERTKAQLVQAVKNKYDTL